MVLSSSEALVRLTGLPKTGKSALCERLMLYMQHKNYRVVYFRYAVASPDMLRTLLARELELPNTANFARMLEDVPQSEDGKPLIMLFEDAHLLSYPTLLEIYKLMQVQTGAERKFNIVLCGEPLLDQRLNRRTELQYLAMLISHNFILHPMNNTEVAGFVVVYMNKAGLPEIKFEPAALGYFCRATGGLPGAARALCNALAITLHGAEAGKQVSKAELLKLVREVQETAADVLPTASGNRVSGPWAVLGPLAIVVSAVSISTLYKQLLDTAEVNPVTAVTGSSTAVSAPNSPFAESAAARVEEAVVEVTVPAIGPEISPIVGSAGVPAVVPALVPALITVTEEALSASDTAATAVADEAAEISDSDLVLVTAAERSVAEIDIAEPIFDEVIKIGASTIRLTGIATPAVIEALPSNSAQNLELTLTQPGPEQAEAAVTDVEAVAQVVAEQDAGNDAVSVVQVAPETQTETDKATETEIVAEAESVTDLVIAAELDAVVGNANADTAPEEPATAVVFVEESTTDQIDTDPASIDQADSSKQTDDVETTAEVASVIESVRDSGQLPDAAALQIEVGGWIAAWQAQDLENIFASYHPNFAPPYHPSRQRWQADRTRVIGNARSITLAMTEFEILASTPQRAEVQFWLDYASATYKDSTQKSWSLKTRTGAGSSSRK